MRLIDITEKLESARETQQWNIGVFRDLLGKLAGALAVSEIDWDHEAGEEWGRVIQGGEVVALLWLRGAFAFLGVNHAAILSRVLQKGVPVQIELVDDWDERKYRINPLVLLRLCERERVSGAFDPEGFSANDLWWGTV